MHTFLTALPTRPRLRRAAAAVALAVLPAAGCRGPDEILAVTDPDIINPGDVQSPAGANAVRVGALARLSVATSGVNADGNEGIFMLGGLLADEWRSGDSFITRDETDQRKITFENTFVTGATRNLHRARLAGEQAVALLREFSPTTPPAQVAEMYFVQAYIENLMAEHYCSGLVFSTVAGGAETFGSQVTSVQTYERALAHADSGLALITATTAADLQVRNALQVTRGRILLNLNRPADAATAVAAVPTSFRYLMQHSQTTRDNAIWALNNNARRYTVSAGEGGVGLNFATAGDPRVPVCAGGSTACRNAGVTQTTVFETGSVIPLHVQLLWPARESSVPIVSGVEARLIEAEAQSRAGNAAGSLTTLNALRAATGTGSGGVAGLAPLTAAATPAAQQDQLFRERAFWLFSRGHRVGDLRRLIRQYGRAANAVFPSGAFTEGGVYGTDVNFPNPQAEENNPNVPAGATCLDREA